MHWLWRTLIAVVISLVFAFCYLLLPIKDSVATRLYAAIEGVGGELGAGAVAYLPLLLAPIAAYGLLTHCFGPQPRGSVETRCRKCGYILRGITEPRCPECGERI